MNNKLYFLLLCTILSITSCSKTECEPEITPCTTNCALEPNVGPCNAAFKRYFFNPETKKCESFVWGGCNGVVPFETLLDCEECKCK